VRQERYTDKVDVYSFGIILWELITRQEPYGGQKGVQIAYAAAEQGLRPEIPAYCPPDYAELMRQCWADKPDDRPTFQAILKRLFQMKKACDAAAVTLLAEVSECAGLRPARSHVPPCSQPRPPPPLPRAQLKAGTAKAPPLGGAAGGAGAGVGVGGGGDSDDDSDDDGSGGLDDDGVPKVLPPMPVPRPVAPDTGAALAFATGTPGSAEEEEEGETGRDAGGGGDGGAGAVPSSGVGASGAGRTPTVSRPRPGVGGHLEVIPESAVETTAGMAVTTTAATGAAVVLDRTARSTPGMSVASPPGSMAPVMDGHDATAADAAAVAAVAAIMDEAGPHVGVNRAPVAPPTHAEGPASPSGPLAPPLPTRSTNTSRPLADAASRQGDAGTIAVTSTLSSQGSIMSSPVPTPHDGTRRLGNSHPVPTSGGASSGGGLIRVSTTSAGDAARAVTTDSGGGAAKKPAAAVGLPPLGDSASGIDMTEGVVIAVAAATHAARDGRGKGSSGGGGSSAGGMAAAFLDSAAGAAASGARGPASARRRGSGGAAAMLKYLQPTTSDAGGGGGSQAVLVTTGDGNVARLPSLEHTAQASVVDIHTHHPPVAGTGSQHRSGGLHAGSGGGGGSSGGVHSAGELPGAVGPLHGGSGSGGGVHRATRVGAAAAAPAADGGSGERRGAVGLPVQADVDRGVVTVAAGALAAWDGDVGEED
jgi:hypothetical protein